ncbi:MAG TPA: COX15/CtaA family protein [Gemmatimonadales bacterium]|nr:COX15/CtaA family protein [Gemmatimonadales bacterium]
MTRFRTLAWAAALCTYLLIVLGAIVRITGSGLGCGDHWPLCNGHLFPPTGDIGTVIEWSHRLVAALVSILVLAFAVVDWRRSMVAVGLLVLQVGLGAITVKLELPPWSVVLHLGTAMLLLATLLVLSSPPDPLSTSWRGGTAVVALLAFVTVLFGALTANLGAAGACGGFPLCSGQIWITAGPLAVIQWIHRLLAYSLATLVAIWAVRAPQRGPKVVLGLVVLQIGVGAATVLLGLPHGLQAAHVALGAAVWAAVVLAALSASTPQNDEAPGLKSRSLV